MGEEFPFFRTFWIERPPPSPHLEPITVHALLDSQSATAAFRFVIMPGDDTVFDTAVTLFPRVDIDQVGVAPQTSMYLFGANERNRVDDWRPAVHDSDGLLRWTGHGETLWAPVEQPGPAARSAASWTRRRRASGLQQRERSFADYEDLESRYDLRPCAWVEPAGDWGEGLVMLVEIPSDKEVNDNMVAFWRPKAKLQAGIGYNYGYRLHWSAAPPVPGLPAPFTATMAGPGPDSSRYFVLDVGALPSGAAPKLDVTSDKGQLRNMIATPKPGHRGLAHQLRTLAGAGECDRTPRPPDGRRHVPDRNLALPLDELSTLAPARLGPAAGDADGHAGAGVAGRRSASGPRGRLGRRRGCGCAERW